MVRIREGEMLSLPFDSACKAIMMATVRKTSWTLALAMCASLALAGADKTKVMEIGYGRPPLNSFCNVTPHTTNQLINQVKGNSVVMDRYTRHFAMTEDEVVAFFSTLVPGRLIKDGIYTVYGVPRDGKLHVHRRLLKKGEKVFMDSQGRAILQMRCGNPLTLGSRNPIALSEGPEPAGPMDTNLVAETGDVEEAPATLAYVAPVTPGPIIPPTPPAEVVAVHSRGAIIPIPLLIPILIGGSCLIPKGGGGGKVVCPEPASMAVLALGFGALATRRRKKQA